MADDDAQGSDNRIALGMALGIPFGVVLSLLLDNWGLLAVGIALGAAFGVVPGHGRRTPEEDDPASDE